MKTINTLSSIDGRKILREVFHELRYERQMSGIATLFLCWRICVYERELNRYIKKDVSILHPLGIFSGTGLWMEEILNRFYYSTINSFVYLGAAILLVLIGIRRFNDNLNINFVIAGIAFEAMMLITLFVVMLFTPNEDLAKNGENNIEESDAGDELLLEIGEISRDFAAVVDKLEKIEETNQNLIKQQNNLILILNKLTDVMAQASSPNPEMISVMKDTNDSLKTFNDTLVLLNHSAEAIKKEEIEFSIKKELERIIFDKVTH